MTDIQKVSSNISVFSLFKYASFKDSIIVILALILSILMGATKPLLSLILGTALGELSEYPNNFIKEEDKAKERLDLNISKLSTYFVYLAIITFVGSSLQIFLWKLSAERISLRIRKKYIRAIFKQKIEWFDNQLCGNLINNISKEIDIIHDGISENFGTFIENSSCFLFGIIIALSRGWKLALVMLASIPLTTGCIIIASIIISKKDKTIDFMSMAQEVISEIKTVILYNASKKEIERFEKLINLKKKHNILITIILAFGYSFMFFFMFSNYALGFWYGSKLIIYDNYNTSKIANVFLAIAISSSSLGETAFSIKSIIYAKIAASKIYPLLDKESMKKEDEKSKRFKFSDSIEIKNVSFKYPSRSTMSISDLSLKIPKGKRIALVGSSGSGKSTIIQLLEKFYIVDGGMIEIDGTNINNINTKSLREKIGFVTQDPILFSTTIFENISLGSNKDQNILLDDVIEVCKIANIHDFIMTLPEKYFTVVGRKGCLLSGGQKQRICIARAIISEPEILLLDEATSALDTQSEKIVQNSIDMVSNNRTTITVAHRLSTIKNSDIIYVMEEGNLIESGNHEELINKKGSYYQLVENQKLKENKGEDIENTKIDTDINEKEVASDANLNKKYVPRDIKMIASINSYLLDKAKTIKQFKNKSLSYFRLLKYALKYKLLLILSILGTIFDGSIYPIYSILFAQTIKSLSINDTEIINKNVSHYVIMFLILGIVAFISKIAKLGLFEILGHKMIKDVRYEIFKLYFKQDLLFFDLPQNNPGSLGLKLNSEADKTVMLFKDVSIFVLTCFTGFCLVFSLSFYHGWKLSLALMGCFVLLALSKFFKSNFSISGSKKVKKANETSSKIASEMIQNIKTIYSLTKEEKFLKNYFDNIIISHDFSIKISINEAFWFGLSNSLTFLFNATAYYYGSRLVLNDGLDIGSMIQIIVTILFLATIIGHNTHYLNSVHKAKVAADSFFNLKDGTIKDQNTTDLVSKKLEGKISADNVYFSYPCRKEVPIFSGLTINIPSYKHIAIVGPSGSGKSTLFGLLQRFYNPTSGRIDIDDAYIKQWDLNSLRSQMAMVKQEPVLFNYTIAENISYGMDGSSMDDIIKYAKIAYAHDFIMKFPDGYDTKVGELGSKLSGGQKQRIAIARALIREPSLLFLDEATSALDSHSEQIVQKAISNAVLGRTSISVAHRLSSIQNCDLIIVLKEGKVVEMGTHFRLLENKSVYYDLACQQHLND